MGGGAVVPSYFVPKLINSQDNNIQNDFTQINQNQNVTTWTIYPNLVNILLETVKNDEQDLNIIKENITSMSNKIPNTTLTELIQKIGNNEVYKFYDSFALDIDSSATVNDNNKITLTMDYKALPQDNYQYNLIVFNSSGVVESEIMYVWFESGQINVDIQTVPGNNICLLFYLTKII